MSEIEFERLVRARLRWKRNARLRRIGDRLRKRLARYLEVTALINSWETCMNGHTERTQRLLLLWLDLQQAIGKINRRRVNPWQCAAPEVARLWTQITDPGNQRALEEWLYQSVEGQPAEWARQALQACRERQHPK